MRFVLGLVTAGAVLAGASRAEAGGDVTITLSPDGQQLASDLGISVEELTQRAEDKVAEAYEVYRVDAFLRAFADATSFSSRGIGVDYASNSDGVMFGLSANVSVATDDLQQERDAEHPVAGVAANLALMGGVNLARWGHPKWTLYGNAFHRSGSYDQLDGTITSVGVHAQVKLGAPTRGNKALVLQWGGVDLTAGLEAARWAFGAGDEIDTTYTVDGTNASTDVQMAATGRFDLESNVVTVPLEATTSLRILYFLSVYGGAGIDLQAGKTTLDGKLDATMTATDPMDGSTVDMGTAAITVDGSQSPSAGKLRFLLGTQVNLWKLKVFVQANAMPFSAASVAFGLRVVL